MGDMMLEKTYKTNNIMSSLPPKNNKVEKIKQLNKPIVRMGGIGPSNIGTE